jgi:hypothetical protein
MKSYVFLNRKSKVALHGRFGNSDAVTALFPYQRLRQTLFSQPGGWVPFRGRVGRRGRGGLRLLSSTVVWNNRTTFDVNIASETRKAIVSPNLPVASI